MQFVKRIIFVLTLTVFCTAYADQTSQSHATSKTKAVSSKTDASRIPPKEPPASPWFTGPILAPSGHTYPKGALGFEPYLFYTDDFGIYDARWRQISTVQTRKVNPQMIIYYGLTNNSDIEIIIPYVYATQDGATGQGFGDIALFWDYQILQDVPHTWRPDLKFTIGETFPVGRYENLNPISMGTDGLGAGSFQTTLAATFQKLWYLASGRFLRARLNFTYTIPASTRLRGLNSYGGGTGTNGTIELGNLFSTDLAFEYTLTQHWVPAIDFVYSESTKSTFTGFRGTTSLGLPAPIQLGSSESYSLAPAIEYNFNANYGVIAGVWFSIAGQDATDFIAGVIAVTINIS